MADQTLGTDINEVRIESLSHIRGQPQVVQHLQLHLAAHVNMRWTAKSPPLFGPALFCGPPGTGKTLMARAVHAELGNLRFIETNGVTLNSKAELYAVLLHADEMTTILIDEAQGLKSETQQVLLTALSERIVRVPGLASSAHQYAIPLANFTMILATTHEYLLQEALRDRMRIRCRFEYYSVEDLVEIVRQRAVALGWQYESEEVLQVVAQRAKATPRQALHRNLQTCWEVAMSHNRNTITQADAQEAFHHLQIDGLGLDAMDRRYLAILAASGPCSLGALSAKLGLPPLTIQRVIEPYLMREDFITKGKSSTRILTDKGRRHMETTADSRE